MTGELEATQVPEQLKFVGSYVDPDTEVQARITVANKAYYRVKAIMNKERGVGVKVKLRLYNSIVKPALMFNLWAIPLRKEQRDRIDRTHRRQLRSLMGYYYKEDEPMVTCQQIYTETDSIPISVELTERRWTLLGHILRLDQGTPANKAMKMYFRKTTPTGEKRTSYAGAPATSVMTMLRDDYRTNTSKAMKKSVGMAQFLYGRDLDKLRALASDRVGWAYIVSHIMNNTKVKWVQANCTRKAQAVPWSHTPVIRVRAEDIRALRRVEVQPRLLTFDEVEATEDEQ